MGEVYRARDGRLKRDVALKVLHAAQVTPELVQRLTREARAAGALNHPSLLAVFDVGTEGAVPYVVSELLEGESLRQRLDRGPIPYRKALEYAIQVAQGLAAAHEKGIWHRDVKPGNVFITVDGRVKLLDFGLAKQEPQDTPTESDETTASALSLPHVVRGTVGYMAPEQVVGGAVDHRADVFALGAVLYEMLTGVRAFQRPTTVETMTAVLKDDPKNPLDLNPTLPPAAAAAVRRCLEKNREERFQSARDLAFHLQQLEQATTGALPRTLPPSRSRHLLLAGVALVAVAATAGIWRWVIMPERAAPVVPPGSPVAAAYRQLTFRPGRIDGARFAGDGVVYSQAIEGRPPEVWRLASLERPESVHVGPANAKLLAVRPESVALCLGRRFVRGQRFVGRLAVGRLGGPMGEERADVEDADWDPSGEHLAVARSTGVGEPSTLEYMGRVLYTAPESRSIHSPRVSRDGQHIAFLEDALAYGDGGAVVVVDRQGRHTPLTEAWTNARGLAWSPRGDEVWFTAAKGRDKRVLRAVDLQGRERVVHDAPGSLTLWDVTSDGRVLLTRDEERMFLMGVPPGETLEHNLAWFDAGGLASLSRDGRFLLFGDRFGVYLRPTDGSPARSLGFKEEAYPDELSPDGTQVLVTTASPSQLMLLPTGSGEVRALPTHGIESYLGARWFPDGQRILFNGRERGRSFRSYVLNLGGGPLRPLTPEGTWMISLSPDGTWAAATGAEQGIRLFPVAGGADRAVPGTKAGDRPEAWSTDGRSLWVFRRGEVPAPVDRLDIATGARERWKELRPPDPSGVYSIDAFRVTPSGSSYFYSYRRVLSELYLVSGLR
jgi:eukaryotic-like serine/threonine-protein kinase